MALKNYYAILGIAATANLEEIKAGYKRKAIEWHPDKNPNRDTTLQMQEINEAYLVLKSDKRDLYDAEYFKHYGRKTDKAAPPQSEFVNPETNTSSFEVEAEKFREQAIAYTKKSLSEILELLGAGGKAFKESLFQSLISWGIVIILFNLIIWMCNK
jgi:curved DNA-binding protein CbpA